MQTLELNKMGLAPICENELQETNGGWGLDDLKTACKKLTPVAFAVFVIENWSDIKKGISDGSQVKF